MGLTNWATFAEQAKMSTRGQWKLLSKLLRSNDPPDTTLAQVMTRRQHTTITCEQQWDSNLGGPIGQCPDPTSLNLTKRELSPPTTSPHVTMQTRATYRIRLNRFAYSAYLLVMTQDKVVSGGSLDLGSLLSNSTIHVLTSLPRRQMAPNWYVSVGVSMS